MRILITGGLGFIGSHLAASLVADGHSLILLDDLSTGKREHAPKGAEVIIEDAAKPAVFDALVGKVDAVYHLAAIASVEMSQKQWLRTHQVNIGALVNLFDAIARSGKPIPVVYASSAAVYGMTGETALTEESQTVPTSAYGADKLACEQHGRIAASIHNIPNIGLRFFNVYGPRQDPASPYSGVISIFAARILKKQPLVINGDGKQSRDFIYVADIVQGLRGSLDALTSGKTNVGVFNLSTGKSTTITQLADTLASVIGEKPNVLHGAARAGDIRHSLGNPLAAEKMFGFKAQTDLSDGLSQTLQWLKGTL